MNTTSSSSIALSYWSRWRTTRDDPSPQRKSNVGDTLLGQFGGCRCQPLAPHLGLWKQDGAVYREGLLLFTVDTPRSDESLDWMLDYQQRLKRQFHQIEIYVAVSELLWL